MMRAKPMLLSFALMGLTTAVAFAHHSFAAFDMSKTKVIKGSVSEVQYRNPHAWLFIDVRNAKGKAETWAIEAGGPNILMRQGWKANTVKVGDEVQALINPFRDPTKVGGSLTALKLPGGKTIGTWKE